MSSFNNDRRSSSITPKDYRRRKMPKPIRYRNLSHLTLTLCLIFIIAATTIPQYTASADLAVNSATHPDRLASVGGDYLRLKASYVRTAGKMAELKKDHTKLLAMVDRLRNKNDKKWVEMRVLYYDFNSSYQSALSHSYEAKLLIKNHPGFPPKEKWKMNQWRNGLLNGLEMQ
jgi:hypothetical protein